MLQKLKTIESFCHKVIVISVIPQKRQINAKV